VNIYVGNTWIMALFDYASQVNNTIFQLETNLYNSPDSELSSGNFNVGSGETMYLENAQSGTWKDYPAPLGDVSSWNFGMHTQNAANSTDTEGNNPFMFYGPSDNYQWVGTQAGFGGHTSSIQVGRDVVDCWYDNGMNLHTGIQRCPPNCAASVATSTGPQAAPLVPPPFPSHRSPNPVPSTSVVGPVVPSKTLASPTPAVPNQPTASPLAPTPAAPPAFQRPGTPTPGPAGR
jgi:hypothetical protein